MIVRASRRAAAAVACLALAASVPLAAGCGGKTREATTAAAPEPAIDADPLALLPGAAIAVANVDARKAYEAGSVGGEVAKLTEQLMPVGQEAGFVASRDVDRVMVGVYSTQGADVAAVVQGRFDAKKIEEVARTKVTTKSGAPLVAAPYGGFTVYTVNNVGFVVLTERTALVGSDAGMRRTLDRVRDKRVQRDFAPGIEQILTTDGAVFALVVDLVSQPGASTAVSRVPLPMLRNLQKGNAVGRFEPAPAQGTVRVTGTLTYGDPAAAEVGAGGVKSVAQLANLLAMTGVAPRFSNLESKAEGADVKFAFTSDEQSLRTFLSNVPRALGR